MLSRTSEMERAEEARAAASRLTIVSHPQQAQGANIDEHLAAIVAQLEERLSAVGIQFVFDDWVIDVEGYSVDDVVVEELERSDEVGYTIRGTLYFVASVTAEVVRQNTDDSPWDGEDKVFLFARRQWGEATLKVESSVPIELVFWDREHTSLAAVYFGDADWPSSVEVREEEIAWSAPEELDT